MRRKYGQKTFSLIRIIVYKDSEKKLILKNQSLRNS
jgi:hypothetical protein